MEIISFEKNTLKKVLWCYLIISIIILVFTSSKFINIVAFSAGTLLGSIKLLLMGKLSTNIVSINKNFTLTLQNIIYLMAILIFYGIIVLSAVKGTQFFVFFTCGVILINFVVFLNSVLELLGIIKNNY